MKNKKEKIEFVIMLLAIICIGFLIYNYPKDFDCYKTQCIEYNIDTFNSCKHIGSESVGFLSSEDFYLCDGVKVAKRCNKFDDVKINLKPTIVDIWKFKCNKLTHEGEKE